MGNELTPNFQSNLIETGNMIPALSMIIGKYYYLLGKSIEGMLSLQIKDPIRIKNITVYLNQIQGWEINQYLKYSTEKTINQFEINLSNFAKNKDYFYIIPSGNYNFTFSINIPLNILPSFLYFKDGKIGYIKYYLLSQIITDTGIELLDEKIILINMTNESIVDKPFPVENKKQIKALFIDYGSNIIRIEMEKGIYNYNKEIKLFFQIDNTNCTGTITAVHFQIFRKVIFFSKNRKQEYNEEQKINEGDFAYTHEPGELKNYEIILFSEGKVIEDYLYFYKNKISNTIFNGVVNLMNYMLPTITTSDIIKCEYKINLSLKYAGIIPDDEYERICVPIIFSSYPGEDPSHIIPQITTEKNKCYMYPKNNSHLNNSFSNFVNNKYNYEFNNNNNNISKSHVIPGYTNFQSILNNNNTNKNNTNNNNNNNLNYNNENYLYSEINQNFNNYPYIDNAVPNVYENNYPNNQILHAAPNINYDNSFSLFNQENLNINNNKDQLYNPNEYNP